MAYPTVVMVSPLSRELSPFDPQWSAPQLQEHLASALRGSGPALSTIEIPQKEIDERFALVVRTSGSTGAPKSVALTGTALLSNARATHNFLEAQTGDRWSLLLPTSHIAGINVLIRSLELGTDPSLSIHDSVDFTAIVPTQLFKALHGDAAFLNHLKACKQVLVGGGALDVNLRKQAEDEGISVVESYGMTETCGGVIYDGKTLAGVKVRITEGRIELSGTQIDAEYLDGEINVHDGWFRTNDLGELRDGKVLIHGRIDDQIVTGGMKVSLSAVENFLRKEFPSIEVVAFSKMDPEWGQRLCLATTSPIAMESVSQSLKNKFGNHVSPKEIHTMESIPYLSIGKPDRKKLEHDYT